MLTCSFWSNIKVMNLSINTSAFKNQLPWFLDEIMIKMIETLPVTDIVSNIFIVIQWKYQGKMLLNTHICMLSSLTFMLLQNEQVNFKFFFMIFFIFQGTLYIFKYRGSECIREWAGE